MLRTATRAATQWSRIARLTRAPLSPLPSLSSLSRQQLLKIQTPLISSERSFLSEHQLSSCITIRSLHSTSPVRAIYEDEEKLHPAIRRVLKAFEDDQPSDSTDPSEVPFLAGGAWTTAVLRNKSFDDLHQLWFVLLRERNMLLTARESARREKRPFSHPQRLLKVKRSMASIKTVLGERERAALKEEIEEREAAKAARMEGWKERQREEFLDNYPINIGGKHHNKHFRGGGKRHRDSQELDDVSTTRKEERRRRRAREVAAKQTSN